jgi:hypothetical protein
MPMPAFLTLTIRASLALGPSHPRISAAVSWRDGNIVKNDTRDPMTRIQIRLGTE